MKYLLDTHAWIWWNSRSEALSPKVRKIIRDGLYEEILLSAISIWEFSKLAEKRRITLVGDGMVWIRESLRIPRLRIIALSPEISWHCTVLPPPFHEDPADQIIVATARTENATLLTADRLIRSYPHVRSAWE